MPKAKNADAYIAAAPGFAQPILNHVRALVHKACPGAKESMKWSHVFFESDGMLCAMAAFKHHCSVGFWHSGMQAVLEENGVPRKEGAGDFGPVRTLADLPKDALLTKLIRSAAALNASKVPARRHAPPRKAPRVPADFAKALKASPAAVATYEGFTPSQRNEYVQWITEAKREETRASRVATAVEWLSEGKKRNWKYAGC
jgi:hypothetical protein